jgi:hypothetical protein
VITAKIRVVNTGESIEGQSIYNGLPLRGGERVSIKIKGNSSTNPGINLTVGQRESIEQKVQSEQQK